MRLANYVSFAVMFGGIYQSCLVLGQLLGYGISNHLRFVVTGSFLIPTLRYLLAGVFVACCRDDEKRNTGRWV